MGSESADREGWPPHHLVWDLSIFGVGVYSGVLESVSWWILKGYFLSFLRGKGFWLIINSTKIWHSRRMCAHLLLWLQVTAEQLSTGECWIPPKKVPTSKDKGEAPVDSGRGKIVFRIKFYTHERCSEGSNKTLCTQGPRDPTKYWAKPAFECLSVSCRGMS